MAQPGIFEHWFSLLREQGLQRQWSAAFVAGVLTLFPLLIAVDLYIDDVERAMRGTLYWVRVGRPLADLLVESLNFGRPVTAMAPLYTLVAIALLSAVGVACSRAYGIRSPFWTAMASLPLMAQPYALQAMSYGFDSLFMALALACAIAAALLVNRGSGWRSYSAALLLQLVSFNLYQPAANGFLVMTGCLCVSSALGLFDRSWQQLSLRLRLVTSAVIYAGGYGLYRLLIALLYEQRLNGYAVSSAELKPFDAALPLALVNSASEPLQTLLRDFGHWPLLLPLLLLVFSYAALVTQWRSLRVAFSAMAALLVVILLAPGGMLLLRDSFVRHPRVLLYFGPLVTSLMLQMLVVSAALKRHLWRLGVLPLIWLMVVFSYSYGHAFAAQARFEQGRLSRIAAAASVLQARAAAQSMRVVMVEGTMPRSPVLLNTTRKFPLIDRLIPPLLDGNQTFSFSQLRLHGLDVDKRRQKSLKYELPTGCTPSSEAICTSEFSLQKVGVDGLVLQLVPDLSQKERPGT